MKVVMKKSLPVVVAVVFLVGASASHAVSCWRGMCTVEPGDTLGKIAQANDVSWRTLAQINGISDPRRIYVGQTIRLAGDDLPPSADQMDNDKVVGWKSGTPYQETYTVERGDTLFAVMRKTGVNWEKLAQLNGLQAPYALNTGQILNISDVKYHN